VTLSNRQREAQITKEIVTVVMGLGLGALVQRFIDGNDLAGGKTLLDVGLGPAMGAIGCIALLLRFYHGNMRILDINADRLTERDARPLWASVIGVVVAEGVLLSALGLFLKNPVNLFNLVLWAIFGDVAWQTLSYRARVPGLRQFHLMCIIVNGATLVGVLLIHQLHTSGILLYESALGWFGLLMIAAFVADYRLNFDVYFASGE
jgi:hypothetical protein